METDRGRVLTFPEERKKNVSNLIELRGGKLLSIRRYENRKIMKEDLSFCRQEEISDKWDRCVEESRRPNPVIKTGPGYGRVLNLPFILDR